MDEYCSSINQAQLILIAKHGTLPVQKFHLSIICADLVLLPTEAVCDKGVNIRSMVFYYRYVDVFANLALYSNRTYR